MTVELGGVVIDDGMPRNYFKITSILSFSTLPYLAH
jgi:hypothetical protein